MEHVVAFNEMCSNDDFGSRAEGELRSSAAHILEQTFSSLIEAQSIAPNPPDLAFAMSVLGVDESTPVDTVRMAYREVQSELLRFGTYLRSPAINLLPKNHLPKTKRYCSDVYSLKYQKCVSQVTAMYKAVSGILEMQRMSASNYTPPVSEMTTVNPPLEPTAEQKHEEYTDQHRVILAYLFRLAEMRARKHEGMVMVPVVTSTGYNSTAYRVECSIDDFVGRRIDRTVEPELWKMVMSGSKITDWTKRVLRDFDHIEFPPLERSRSMAFNDGVYDVEKDQFWAYTKADRRVNSTRVMSPEETRDREELYRQQEELHQMMTIDFARTLAAGENRTSIDSPSSASRTPFSSEQARVQRENLRAGLPARSTKAACVYHDCNFDLQTHAKHAMDIATPVCDLIWKAQDIHKPPKGGPKVVEQIYALIGRMLHAVGTMDDLQVSLFFKGVAGTGKSTILRLIRSFYAPGDVGIIPNNIEPVFGLSAVYQKLVILCFELRSDFGLNPALMQTMMSGEPMTIQVKFKTAIPDYEWKAPFAAAGNMNADWPDAQGAISRRWAIVAFDRTLERGDSKLMSKLLAEMPLLVQKCNRAYLEMVQRIKSHQAWDLDASGRPLVLHKYFHEQRDKLTRQIDSLMSCILEGGRLVRPGQMKDVPEDQVYMRWDDFLKEYERHCKSTGVKKLNMNSGDTYNTTFAKLKIRRELHEMPDYEAGRGKDAPMAFTFWLHGIRLTSTLQNNDDDDDDRDDD